MGVLMEDHNNSEDFSNGLPSIITAAHELKSPLSLIRHLTMTLSQIDLNVSEQKRIIQQINLTSERALRLTGDLTKSVRLNDGMFKMEPINPQQICEDIVKELQPLYKAYGRTINLLNRKSPLLLVANRDLLRRIISNFSDNALYYTDSNLPIEIKISVRGGMVRLSVRDYGPYFGKKINEHNVIKNISSRPQSSGLGLYISKQFAEAMDGRIGITKHSNGTSFYVDLHSSKQLSLL